MVDADVKGMNEQSIQWLKVPSVTTGGKPYFWNGRSPDGKLMWSVVWHRIKLRWQLLDCQQMPIGYFDSDTQAKSVADQLLASISIANGVLEIAIDELTASRAGADLTAEQRALVLWSIHLAAVRAMAKAINSLKFPNPLPI